MDVHPKELIGLTSPDISGYLKSIGERAFHGKQIYQSIYQKHNFELEQIRGLPKSLRQKLSECARITLPSLFASQLSVDGTRKYLFELCDGQKIESVFIPEEARNTLCISTQVGCPMDCKFCLTALVGFGRNLTPGEIIGQILFILGNQESDPSAQSESPSFIPSKSPTQIGPKWKPPKPTNIVLMGMGEPLLNLENVSKALQLMADPDGLSIPPRRITLSTVGLAPKILELAKVPVVPNLAISLSATTDEVRNRLMPVNRKYPIRELMEACIKFLLHTRQRVTFEYVLMDGINDSDTDARRLVRLLSRVRSKVNLLPLNLGKERLMKPSPPERIKCFQEILISKGMIAFIRRPRGADIFAACGQLHRALDPVALVP